MRLVGRIPAPVLVAGALVALSTAWFGIGLVHEWSMPILGWLPLPAISLLSAYTCLKAARRNALAEPVRRFWRNLGSASALLCAAVISHAHDALGHGGPSQQIGTLTSMLYPGVLAIAMRALLRLPAGRRTRGEWARFGLDAGIIVLVSGVVMWRFSLSSTSWSERTGSVVPVLSVIVVASVSIITLIKVTFAGTGGLDRGAMRILSAGTALATVAGVTAAARRRWWWKG